MPLLPSVHPILEFRGSPRAAGKSYGEQQAVLLREALKHIPKGLTSRRRHYARECWQVLRRWERPVVEFLLGVAVGSRLPPPELMALQLFEEYGHMRHCTAMGATGSATRDGSAIIAQSWDDDTPMLYPAVSLLRLRTDATPATLTYALPGRWAAAGINEHGLAVVWTSSGVRPSLVEPRVGVPTYTLVAGILTCRDCAAAVALVRRTRNAGCFIFLLADATGEVWGLEGMPGRVEAIQCRDLITRSNHYQCRAMRCAAKQRLPSRSTFAYNSQPRAARIAALTGRFRGHIDGPVIESIYRDHQPKQGLCICLHGDPGPYLTVDSFYAVPAKREFFIARGYVCRHAFTRHQL